MPRRARELRGRSAGGRTRLRCLPRAGHAGAPRSPSGTGGWRARPLPSVPGGAGTKAPLRCHSCSPCSATAAATKKIPAPGVVTKGCGHPTPSQQM